jgi:hypothetical protein
MTHRFGIKRTFEAPGSPGALFHLEGIMTNDPDPSSETRPVLSTTEARGGVTGHNVRYVLVVGLLAVVVAFAITYTALVAFHA